MQLNLDQAVDNEMVFGLDVQTRWVQRNQFGACPQFQQPPSPFIREGESTGPEEENDGMVFPEVSPVFSILPWEVPVDGREPTECQLETT